MFSRLAITLLISGIILSGCTAHRSGNKSVTASRSSTQTIAARTHARAAGQYVQSANFTSGASPYGLGAGDKVRITVFGQENLSRTYPVDAGGYISMPLIGAVAAGGSTTFQLEDRIASSLRQKYVKDPKVTVEVETYRPFFILGEVRNGGQFPYVAGMTVETAVAIAGGFTARAKKRNVQLSRQVNGRSVVQMVPATWKIQPGDTISVKERFF